MSGISGRASIHREDSFKNFEYDRDMSSASDAESDEESYADDSKNVYQPESAELANMNGMKINWNYVLPVILVIASVAFYNYSYAYTKEKTCSYKKLEKSYPEQDKYLWKSLSVGLTNIINKRSASPGVYLFVYENHKLMSNLVKEIAKRAAVCFDAETVEMTREDFTSEKSINDYGHVIVNFKEKIKKKGQVFLIVNLNEIPGETAKALHAICDTHTPIAKDIVIFLTLTVPHMGDNHLKTTEDYLSELWRPKLDRFELDPLITRVTDQVIPLRV